MKVTIVETTSPVTPLNLETTRRGILLELMRYDLEVYFDNQSEVKVIHHSKGEIVNQEGYREIARVDVPTEWLHPIMDYDYAKTKLDELCPVIAEILSSEEARDKQDEEN